MGMSQLLTAIATMAVKKDLIEEILREPSQKPAPKAEGEEVLAPGGREGHRLAAA